MRERLQHRVHVARVAEIPQPDLAAARVAVEERVEAHAVGPRHIRRFARGRGRDRGRSVVKVGVVVEEEHDGDVLGRRAPVVRRIRVEEAVHRLAPRVGAEAARAQQEHPLTTHK